MKSLRIPLHSFVDLITNSSSELFISATDATVVAATKMINAFLARSGSKQTANDLFKIKLVYGMSDYYIEDGEEKCFATKAELDAFVEKAETDYPDFSGSDNGYKSWQELEITPKKKDADLKKLAELVVALGLTYEAKEFSTG